MIVHWQAGNGDAQKVVEQHLAAGERAEVLRDNPRRLLWRIEAPGGVSLFVKQFRAASGRHPHRERWKSWLGRSPAGREWRALTALSGAGVPVPKPRALGTLSNGDRIVVMDHHRGVTLSEALEGPAGDRKQALVATGRAIAALHAAGWMHCDLHQGNVLVTEENVLLVDVQHARPSRGSRALRDDLGALDFSLWGRSTRADRVRLGAAGLGLRMPFDPRGRSALREVGQAAEQRARQHWRSRTRRSLRPGRRFATIHVFSEQGDLRGLRLRDLEPEHVETALKSHLDALRSGDARLVKKDLRSRISRVESGGQSLLVKEFGWRGFPRALADLLRGSPARRAWRAGHGLAARGIGTALPLAYLERRVLGTPVASLVLLEDLRPGRDAIESLALREASPERVVSLLLGLVVALHRCGVDHGDLKATHVFLCGEASTGMPRLLDLEGVRFPRKLSEARRIHSLAELNASLPDDVGAALRRHALTEYARALPFPSGLATARGRIVKESLTRAHRWSGKGCRESDARTVS